MANRTKLLGRLTALCLAATMTVLCVGCDEDFEDEFEGFFEVVDEWWYDDYYYHDPCCGGSGWDFDFWHW